MSRILILATSRKTRGGITSVVKAHETGEQWKKFHCQWIQTHRDGGKIRKVLYFISAFIEYLCFLPFCNIVHIHVGVRASVKRKLIFARLAKLFNKRIIVHFHPASERHLVMPEYKNSFFQLFSLSDLLIVLAPHWIDVINTTFPNNKFHMDYIYNPCPKVNRDFSQKTKSILFAGTLIERKGYQRLLHAFAQIYAEFPEWRLEFAGNGQLEKASVLQRELGIPEAQVKYLGWVSGSKKDAAFHRASIYCLPSDGEGFPMGVLDALAYGDTVVTTPVGGIVDVLVDGINCLIFNHDEVEQLAHCLAKLMRSKELREQLQHEADKLVHNEFNIQNICKKLDIIYSQMQSEKK